jgi:hypothetical protein
LAKCRLLKSDALNIARKLNADVEPAGKHQKATFWYNGLLILTFGIRHGKDEGHGHLVGQNKGIFLNETKAVAFARCAISFEAYINILRERGIIPAEGAGP